MAVNDNEIKVNPTAKAMSDLGGLMSQAEQAAKQGGAQTKPAAGGGFSFSFANTNTFGAPIGRGIGSEYLAKLMTALAEDFKQAVNDVEITLLPIDNANETSLHYSVIIVCMRLKGDAKIAYHTLVVEATGEKISPIFENYNNNQVEVLRLPSDAANAILANKVQEKVLNNFGQGTKVLSCDYCIVPRSVNPEDKVLIHKVALNAGTACNTELFTHQPGFQDLNLTQAIGDTNLVINVAFQQQQMEDAVGEPVRSDVLINFIAQKRNDGNRQQQQMINSGDRDVRIADASAFIDLVWAPAQPQQQMNWNQGMMGPAATQKYAARAIITNLGSNLAYTPASMLLALLSTLSLSENNNWFQSFRPVPTDGKEVDLRDIGALNIEANLNNEPNGVGTRIDTKSASFGLEHLGSLITNTIRPGLLISMDIPEAGPQTWYMAAHSHASTGNDLAAANYIVEAANALTNGGFSRNFQSGAPIYVDNGNRIHLGHWIDRNGNRRDIRDIDLLAVANLVGERNPTAMREWSDTFTRQDLPLNYRLAVRKKMIYALTNETAEFTGWAQRVTFSGAFLEALFRGAQEAGLNLRVSTPLSAADFNNQRGVAEFVGNALLTSGRVFNQSGMGGFSQQYAQSQFIADPRRVW